MNHFAVHLKLTQHCQSTTLQLKKKRPKIRRWECDKTQLPEVGPKLVRWYSG